MGGMKMDPGKTGYWKADDIQMPKDAGKRRMIWVE